MRSDKHVIKRNKRKRLFETLLSLIILFTIFLGVLTGYYGSKVTSFLDGVSSDDVNPEDPESIEISKKIEDLNAFSALILGLDLEDSGVSRSDTIIAITVNPNKESIKMISIPRDTLVTLPNGQMEKINAAYATGVPNTPHSNALNTMEAVGDLLNIPIQFYTTMDFNGLVALVDAIGGITVDADFAFIQNDYYNRGERIHIEEGIQKLGGAEALGYAVMRQKDPRGDFGRQERQREVVVEVLNELDSFNTIANMTPILNAIQPYLNTNATTNQMIEIALNYSNTLSDIEQLELGGYSGTEYFPHYGHDVYVWEPYEESLSKVQYELRTHLELDTADYNDIQSEVKNAKSSQNNFNHDLNNNDNQY